MAKSKASEPAQDDMSRYVVSGKAGEAIFQEGEDAADMFIIQEGRVELWRTYAGEQQQVAALEPGDFFGEMSLLDAVPREVTARAATDFCVLRIDGTTFRQVVRESPEIPVQMLRRLAHRLHEYQEAAWRAAQVAMGPLKVDVPQESAAPSAQVAMGLLKLDVPQESAAPSALCAVLVEQESGKRLPVPRGHATVGRVDRTSREAPDVDLTSFENGRSAGRRHACITFHDGKYFVLEETATRNGTFVNDARVSEGAEVRLRDGDRVRFGQVDFVFRLE